MAVELQPINPKAPFKIMTVLQANGQILFKQLQQMAISWQQTFGVALTITKPPAAPITSSGRETYLYRLRFFDWCAWQINQFVSAFNQAGMRQDDANSSPVPQLLLWAPHTLAYYDARLTQNINKIQAAMALLQHLFKIYGLKTAEE